MEGCSKMNVCRVLRLDLHRGSFVGKRTDEAVSVAKLRDSDRDFGLDNGVDATDFVSNLPGTLEHLRVLHIASPVIAHVSTSKTTCMIIYYLCNSDRTPTTAHVTVDETRFTWLLVKMSNPLITVTRPCAAVSSCSTTFLASENLVCCIVAPRRESN